MRVLGIETSCDETGVAIYEARRGLLAHRLYSQAEQHAEFGGVVPELASRDHLKRLAVLVNLALEDANLKKTDLSGIACTAGPGLIGALLAGLVFSGGLARALGVPLIGVHHMEAHLLAPLLEGDSPEFPYLALLVSGGHSLLVDVRGYGDYAVLGESLDDAAGEAFDKGAKLLGLGYPGGPEIARLAEKGEPGRFSLPVPMRGRKDLNFSFSGLKTALLYKVRDLTADGPLGETDRASLALALETAIVESLVDRSTRALDATGYGSLVVAGGVGANRRLRLQLKDVCGNTGVSVYYPRVEFCTDNGAMIALTGCLRLAGGAPGPAAPDARPRWNINEVTPFSPA
ncbi:MAG: tRNA (adenosine(37)-N6)-threonylcarbamoyltransferase complex transferase subunit TsaD [Gammaproteobacteria bacterium]|nr:tRNA (adenosine(37)-N6)-threonylcarbamoyltransferase complex transferase subunit TsaD [Gammaproteobacteria bacterium]MDE0414671.1 tRNA (adenosine(37)-N6)-threonylcarbamoyltransferase complex transferase subunit TsaD [Gammaproteobacteria bacterium]